MQSGSTGRRLQVRTFEGTIFTVTLGRRLTIRDPSQSNSSTWDCVVEGATRRAARVTFFSPESYRQLPESMRPEITPGGYPWNGSLVLLVFL